MGGVCGFGKRSQKTDPVAAVHRRALCESRGQQVAGRRVRDGAFRRRARLATANIEPAAGLDDCSGYCELVAD